MDRSAALDELPTGYAAALRLRDRGLSEEAIALELGIEAASVGPLLSVAEAKLARLIDGEAVIDLTW